MLASLVRLYRGSSAKRFISRSAGGKRGHWRRDNDHCWRNVAVFRSSASGNAVFGDSIAARGFHGVPGFVNLALPGEAPIVTELKVAAYFNSRRPNYVIIAFNPNIFRRSPNIELQQYTCGESELRATRRSSAAGGGSEQCWSRLDRREF